MSTPHPIVNDHQVWMNLAKVVGALVALTFGLIAIVAAIS